LALTTHSKLVFYKDEDVIIEIQDLEGQFHVHCTVINSKLSVFKRCYRVLAKLMEFAKHLDYDYMVSVSPNRKFCEMYGATCIGEQEGHEVMIWDLK